jgi:hypothetical protein
MNLHHLIHRWHSLAILGLTAAALLATGSLFATDAPLLAKRGVDLTAVQTIYGVLLIAVALGLKVEPRLIHWLERCSLRHVLRAACALTIVMLLTLLNPIQEARLFQTPTSLIVIILHGIATTVLVGDLTGWKSLSEKVSVTILGLVIVALVLAHVTSVGSFMGLDLPDEPWLASMATNFAENHDLSPSFIGSPYGSPDVILPRYYALMGLWLRAVGSSVEALRVFPLLTAAAGALLMIWLLWSVPLRLEQRLSGLAVLLALSAFVRMSHNLRQDILLAVYGAALLLALLRLLRRGQGRWAVLAGAALLIGLESIPFMALVLGLSAGVLLMIRAVSSRAERRPRLREAVLYGMACAIVCAIYVALRALPDPAASLEHYRNFNRVYSGQTAIGMLRSPVETLINYHARFSLILSPVEGILILTGLILLWRRGDSAERWIIGMFGLAFAGAFLVIGVAYGYWTMCAPLAAYAAARTLTANRLRVVWVCVLLPALATPPLLDLTYAIAEQPNQSALAEAAPIVQNIPPGGSVVGDDLLWFDLHVDRRFIGWGGMGVFMSARQIPDARSALEALDVTTAICSQPEHCSFVESSRLFGEPEVIVVDETSYFIYRR